MVVSTHECVDSYNHRSGQTQASHSAVMISDQHSSVDTNRTIGNAVQVLVQYSTYSLVVQYSKQVRTTSWYSKQVQYCSVQGSLVSTVQGHSIVKVMYSKYQYVVVSVQVDSWWPSLVYKRLLPQSCGKFYIMKLYNIVKESSFRISRKKRDMLESFYSVIHMLTGQYLTIQITPNITLTSCIN